MQTLLTKTNTKTNSVREFITWLSFAGEDIFVHEFYELGMNFHVYDNHIVIICTDGTCRLDLNHHFVDASSLMVLK